MKHETTHRQNKVIILVMTAIALAAIIALFSSCGAMAKQGGEFENKDTSATNTQENTTTSKKENTTIFDKSTTQTEGVFSGWEPIDPSKQMEVRETPDGSVTRNARKVYTENKTTTTNDIETTLDTQEQTDSEAVTTTKAEKVESGSWYQKFKIGIPWYVVVFGGLFFLILIFGLVILYKVFRIVSPVAKHVPQLLAVLDQIKKNPNLFGHENIT